MRALTTCLTLLGCLLLAACSDEPTRNYTAEEPSREATGFYCGMLITEHQGPKGQIQLDNPLPRLWFSSVRDALTYAAQEVANDGEIAGFWVNDMSKGTWEKPAPGSWVDARKAFFVIGSNKASGMGGGEAVPFGERSQADAFAKINGGHVVDYQTARQEITTSTGDDS